MQQREDLEWRREARLRHEDLKPVEQNNKKVRQRNGDTDTRWTVPGSSPFLLALAGLFWTPQPAILAEESERWTARSPSSPCRLSLGPSEHHHYSLFQYRISTHIFLVNCLSRAANPLPLARTPRHLISPELFLIFISLPLSFIASQPDNCPSLPHTRNEASISGA